MRIACLAVLDLPLQALWRADPELRGVPLAVTAAAGARRSPSTAAVATRGARSRSRETGANSRATETGANTRSRETGANSRATETAVPLTAKLIAVSPEAAALGVAPGQTAAQARAVAPSLIVRAAPEEMMAAARAALFDVALGFAPRAEPPGAPTEPATAAADLAYLEVGDLGRLYPTERELALALRARARAVGLQAGVGIAASKGVARLAAWSVRGDGGIRVVPSGEEAGFVGGLPVAALFADRARDARAAHGGRALGVPGERAPGGGDALATLGRWGIKTCAGLAALPAKEVALRLGPSGARLHRLASGRGDEPLLARAPADEFLEGAELDWAVAELEPLAFVLRGLIDRLVERLAARHLACAGLAVRLRLEDGGHDVREVAIAAPTRDVPSLVTLLRLGIERRPPAAPVVGATLLARAACTRESQQDLFLPAGPAPERLATTIAKLQALAGEDGVGSPRVPDVHREEAITMVSFAPQEDVKKEKIKKRNGTDENRYLAAAAPRPAVLAFRRFRPERPVEVLLDGGAVPRALSGDGLSGQVMVAAGPYRVCGEWWSTNGFARDYWDLHASDGALYRVYCDAAGSWFVAGYYD